MGTHYRRLNGTKTFRLAMLVNRGRMSHSGPIMYLWADTDASAFDMWVSDPCSRFHWSVAKVTGDVDIPNYKWRKTCHSSRNSR
jgi:hypothetical protein